MTRHTQSIGRWRAGQLSDAELQAAFAAARQHGAVLKDDVLSAIVAAVAEATHPATPEPRQLAPMPLADGYHEDHYAEYLSAGAPGSFGDWMRAQWHEHGGRARWARGPEPAAPEWG